MSKQPPIKANSNSKSNSTATGKGVGIGKPKANNNIPNIIPGLNQAVNMTPGLTVPFKGFPPGLNFPVTPAPGGGPLIGQKGGIIPGPVGVPQAGMKGNANILQAQQMAVYQQLGFQQNLRFQQLQQQRLQRVWAQQQLQQVQASSLSRHPTGAVPVMNHHPTGAVPILAQAHHPTGAVPVMQVSQPTKTNKSQSKQTQQQSESTNTVTNSLSSGNDKVQQTQQTTQTVTSKTDGGPGSSESVPSDAQTEVSQPQNKTAPSQTQTQTENNLAAPATGPGTQTQTPQQPELSPEDQATLKRILDQESKYLEIFHDSSTGAAFRSAFNLVQMLDTACRTFEDYNLNGLKDIRLKDIDSIDPSFVQQCIKDLQECGVEINRQLQQQSMTMPMQSNLSSSSSSSSNTQNFTDSINPSPQNPYGHPDATYFPEIALGVFPVNHSLEAYHLQIKMKLKQIKKRKIHAPYGKFLDMLEGGRMGHLEVSKGDRLKDDVGPSGGDSETGPGSGRKRSRSREK